MNDKKTDYKSAGVDIKAGNEAVNLIKEKVKDQQKYLKCRVLKIFQTQYIH